MEKVASAFISDDKGLENIVYSIEDSPFGLSMGGWTARWWQWLVSIQKDKSPCLDDVGSKFDPVQQYSDVIFMASTFGGLTERTYCIPKEKSILLPIMNFATSFIESPNLKTEADLISAAERHVGNMKHKSAVIDGRDVSEIEKFRIRSPIFELTYPENNAFDLRPGSSKAISDGYWIFLKPLSYGKHIIQVYGSCSSGKTVIGAKLNLHIGN
jgi:hypothetical protein